MVTSADTPRYVFRNDSIAPFSLYEVKVGVYNNRGEGPFSPVTTVFSAEEGTAGDSSAPTIRRWAQALIRGSVATSGVPPPVTEVSRGPQCRTEQQPSPRGVRGPVGGHGWSARNPFVRRPPRVPPVPGTSTPSRLSFGVRLRRSLGSALASGFVAVLRLVRGTPSVTPQSGRCRPVAPPPVPAGGDPRTPLCPARLCLAFTPAPDRDGLFRKLW